MSDQITRISLDNAAEKLRDQIRSAFVELIPPEQWHEMINNELKKFIEKGKYNSCNNSYEPSLLEVICRKEFENFIGLLVKEILKSYEYKTDYSNQISTEIKRWLTDNADRLVEATIISLCGTTAQAIIENIKYRP